MLIDLRPVADRWPVEVMATKARWVVGQLEDLPLQLADDAACANAMSQAARAGWFVQEGAQTFDLWYSWDTPEAMRDYIVEEWNGYCELLAQVYEQAQALWVQAGSGRIMRVRLKMHLGRWRK
jgi:hypothetical protein